MPKKRLNGLAPVSVAIGDKILDINMQYGAHFDVEREVPYTQGTILLIKTGHGPGGDYTLGQVAERIGIGHTNQGSWLSTRGEGRYLSDADIDALIEKSGGVQVLREGTGI